MIVDSKRVYVLAVSDEGVFTDRDGVIHNMFVQNRRLLMLSVPKSASFDLGAAYDDEVEQLVEAVQKAIDGPER